MFCSWVLVVVDMERREERRGWERSREEGREGESPKAVCQRDWPSHKAHKGRNLPSVSKYASKMQDIPLPVSTQRTDRALLVTRRVRVREVAISFVYQVTVGGEHAAILPLHPTVILKMCFLKSKVMFTGNLYVNYKQNSDNRQESLQTQDRVWNIYDLCTA